MNDRTGNKGVDNMYVSRMFGLHGEERVIEFVKKAKYFRLISALGGHANDPDQMFAQFSISSYDDLVNIAIFLGIEFQKPGPGDDLAAHHHLGAHHLCGYRFFITVYNNILTINASNSSQDSYSYDLCIDDYAAALTLEEKIDNSFLASKAVPPSRTSINDITKEHVALHLGYDL